MITPKEIILPEDVSGIRYALVRYWRELLIKLNILEETVAGLSGGGVSDGDKGDVIVSGSGTVWTLDPAVASPAWTSLTATLPSGSGVLEYEQTVIDATVTGTSKIFVFPASGTDTDENQAEDLNIRAIAAYPSAGSFVLNMQFNELHAGNIKLIYQVK